MESEKVAGPGRILHKHVFYVNVDDFNIALPFDL